MFSFRTPKIILGLGAAGSALGVVILVKDWSGGQDYEGNEQLGNKTVIITGATSGIGKATAENLAKRGGRIILACKDMEKCAGVCQELIEATKNKNLFCRKLDLSSIESIKSFAHEFNKTEERLDILINNAGVMTKKRVVTRDGFESQMGVNFFGRFLLTNLLLDKMKSTDSWGRIINVVCFGYHRANIEFTDFNQEHANSERAGKMSSLVNVNFAKELAERLEGSKIGVYCANPGMAETNLRKDFGIHKSLISGLILRPFFAAAFRVPRQACQTVLHCALSPDLEGQPEHSGKVFYKMLEEQVNEEKTNEFVRKRIWAIAEYWTGLRGISSVSPSSSSSVQSKTSDSDAQPSSSAVAVAN